jgi:hypothetical protein
VYPNDVWVLQNANNTGGTPKWTQLGRPKSKAVFIRKKLDNYRFTILELANQQDIAYGAPWKLVRFLASLAVALLQ